MLIVAVFGLSVENSLRNLLNVSELALTFEVLDGLLPPGCDLLQLFIRQLFLSLPLLSLLQMEVLDSCCLKSVQEFVSLLITETQHLEKVIFEPL